MNYSLHEAIQHLQKIISQNPAEKTLIYERLYNLYSILQYPNRTFPDGTPLSVTQYKSDRNSKNDSNDDDTYSSNQSNISSEKLKNSSLNTEFSRRNANELERKRVNNRLNGFSLKDSVAWQEICKRYGPNLNQSELLSMAEIIGQEAGIKVDREAKRRKEVLIKWFEENLEIVLKMLPYFKLVDSDGNALKGDDQENADNDDDENDINSDGNSDGNNNEKSEEYINKDDEQDNNKYAFEISQNVANSIENENNEKIEKLNNTINNKTGDEDI